MEGEWTGVAVRVTCHVFMFSEKAKNENRKKLKRIGKSYIFKVESKYFVSRGSRPLRVQCKQFNYAHFRFGYKQKLNLQRKINISCSVPSLGLLFQALKSECYFVRFISALEHYVAITILF